MGLFDFFNENKKKWLRVQNNENQDAAFRSIINDFFIADNILLEYYIENQRANDAAWSGGLDDWEFSNKISIEPQKPIKCSPSFRQHFSNDTFDRGTGIPDWFYIAYPDVAFWLHKNLDNLQEEIGLTEEEAFGEEGIKPLFFRKVIDRFKITKGKLECSA